MVKMSLGASNSQSSSTSSISSDRISAYNNAISSLTSFISASDLQGQAYSSAKSYASSVLIPLIQGAILLSEAVSNSVSEFPSRYTSEVAGESLDSEVLEAQIATYQAAYNRTSALLESLMSKEVLNPRTISQVQSAMSRNMSKIRELQEKLDKLLAFDASSPSIFDDISSLESAVAQGLSQVNDGFSTFNGTFSIPSRQELAWVDTISSAWEKREKEMDGKLLSQEFDETIANIAKESGLTIEEVMEYVLYVKKPVGISKKAITVFNKYITYRGEKRFINGRKITVDSKGRVQMGSQKTNLYNKETSRVYVNRVAKTFEDITGEADIRKTDIGKGIKTTGWRNALGDAKVSAKNSFKSSLNITKDFNWKDASKLTNWGKTAKGLGAVGTALSIGGNIKENFFDDKSSSIGEKVRNFAVDQGVDTVSGAGAAATGAAIGTMVGGPVGTIIGVAAGMGISWAMSQKWIEGDSVTGWAKKGMNGMLGG